MVDKEDLTGRCGKVKPDKPLFFEPTDVDLSKGFTNYDRNPDSSMSLKMKRRMQDREEWDMYWRLQRNDVSHNWLWKPPFVIRYYFFDRPATFFREKIVEPLHDRFKRPYYHRRLNRVPEIDQCGVNDDACIYEAAEQFRLDKLVDRYIMHTLQQRAYDCLKANKPYQEQCIRLLDSWQESELNWFIKYGELGAGADVNDCYMKQKHRMIWERRHPEIMEERQKRYEEHKRRVANGDLDYHFYKKGFHFQDKKTHIANYAPFIQKATQEGDQPVSKDWEYYKRLSQDPDYDKKQGVVHEFSINPFRGLFG